MHNRYYIYELRVAGAFDKKEIRWQNNRIESFTLFFQILRPDRRLRIECLRSTWRIEHRLFVYFPFKEKCSSAVPLLFRQ